MTPRVAAVILAGGKGERLGGVIKSNLDIGGIRLLERVSAALGDRIDTVLISTGAFAADDIGLLAGQIAVPDLASDYGGPLAGVAAAVAWCLSEAAPPDLLLSAAVDTPFLPPDFAVRMLAALTPGAPAVIARCGGQDYPTNALWRLPTVANLPARLAAGTAPRSLRRLADDVGAAFLDWPTTGGNDPFANVNTPGDLARLDSRARRGN